MIKLAVIGTGTIAQLHASAAQSLVGWWQPHAEGKVGSTHFYGSEGYARFLPTSISRMERRSLEAQLAQFSASDVDDLETEFARMYRAQLAHLLDCIEDGIQPEPGGLHGYVNMQIIDAAYESNRRGQAVFLEEQQ